MRRYPATFDAGVRGRRESSGSKIGQRRNLDFITLAIRIPLTINFDDSSSEPEDLHYDHS